MTNRAEWSLLLNEQFNKCNKANETDGEGGTKEWSLENGCSNATFAPGGTVVGETRVQQ